MIIHAEGVRFAFSSSGPDARKLFRFHEGVPRTARKPTNSLLPGDKLPPGFADWQRLLARWQSYLVDKWCWVTLGKQSRVISRECPKVHLALSAQGAFKSPPKNQE